MVGGAAPGRRCRRLVERPAEDGRALTGQVTRCPLRVRFPHRDVQTGVAHGVRGGTEPAAVTEFLPNGHRQETADPEVALEGPAADLVTAEGDQIVAQPGELGVQTVDLTESHLDGLPPRGAQVGPLEMGLAVGVEQMAGEGGDPLVEQGGPDALHPPSALVGQGLVQPHPGSDLEHVVRGDPRLGQPAHRQQLPQEPGVGAVGLGPLLTAALLGRVGRLGQMASAPTRSSSSTTKRQPVQPSKAKATSPRPSKRPSQDRTCWRSAGETLPRLTSPVPVST